MKKVYCKPTIEVIEIKSEGVIASSCKPNHGSGCGCAHCNPNKPHPPGCGKQDVHPWSKYN